MAVTHELVGCYCISLILFFALFFGLNYPEIQHQSYTETMCTLTSIHLKEQYRCYKSCPLLCRRSIPYSKTCDQLFNEFSSFDPVRCKNGSGSCPNPNQGCNNGYKCCYTSCDRCCDEKCDSKGENCRKVCIDCRCKCTDWIWDNECHIACPIYYDVLMKFTYSSENGDKKMASSISKSFGTNKAEALKFYEFYDILKEFTCYFNPNDPKEVLLDINQSGWKWAITVLFGMIPLAICTVALVAEFYLWSGFDCTSCCRRKETTSFAENIPSATPYEEHGYATAIEVESNNNNGDSVLSKS